MFASPNNTLSLGLAKSPSSSIHTARIGLRRIRTDRPNGLTIVAHDLRGPLSSLRLLVEAMGTRATKAGDVAVAVKSARAERILDSLDRLLNGILERVSETGDPLALKPEVIDLSDLFDDAVSINSPRAQARSIKLQTVSDERCKVRGDRQLLLQVLDNIIGNAIKHSPYGGTVTCLVEQSGDHATMSISDEGPGMTPTDLKRAFAPFTKLSAKAADNSQSWGLGLWMAKVIISQHGGDIEVQSGGRGKGTEFRVSLLREI